MSDHHAMEQEGPWPAGWIWAVGAAVIAAILARWLGDVSVPAALLVGLMAFVVYSVLFAQFWEAPASGPDEHGHGHHAAPAAAPLMASVVSDEPAKPQGLPGPRDGMADDLKEIEGIGPALEKLCHELGIYHYDQIAVWGVAETAWMDGNLKGFKGRVTRDKWVAQARLIASEGLEAFRVRAKTNDY